MGLISSSSGIFSYSRQFLDFATRKIYKNVEVVFIEGGLGSQLMGTFEYLSRIELDKDKKTLANLDYFENEKTYRRSGNSFWPWSLWRYDIDPIFFEKYSQESNFLKHRKNRINTWATPDHWEYIKSELPKKFIVDELRVTKVLEEHGATKDYSVLHVRRGDYLKVASRIMEHEENIKLLKQIMPMLKGKIFVVSDESFTNEIKNLYTNCTEMQVIFLDPQSEPDYVIHDLMRMSSVLITSNSTFSFTAGILAKPETRVFTPNFFYGSTNYPALTQNFQSASNFSLIN